MSSVKIQGDASGTGILTIAAPNTNTDRTLTLPDVGGGEFIVSDASGNVGIGTSSPADALHISNSSTTDIGIRLDRNSSERANLQAVFDGAWLNGAQTVRFATGDTERMRIDSSGNLLVGTTTVSAVLTVDAGPATARYTNITTGATFFDQFRFNSGLVGSITTNGVTTAYNTSSDYRLKEDWQPVANASTRVEALKPVNFAWKADGSRVDGFLAHELAEVIPEAVTGEKDAVDDEGNPEYQGIDQSKVVPLLTAALQEALAEIKDLKARLDTAGL